MFKDGIDQGYRENPRWWWDGPDAFRMADLDTEYPAEYFPLAEPPYIKEFCNIVQDEFTRLTGRRLSSIVEFGSGGGWYLKEWQDRGLKIQGIEGSAFGVAECLKRGVLDFNIYLHDLRLPLERRFKKSDIAICTEVAEHISLNFHSTLVKSLTDHSDIIWWSSEGPEINNSPHLHHVAEMPQLYWEKLFHFFGFSCQILPDEIYYKTEMRGRCLFIRTRR